MGILRSALRPAVGAIREASARSQLLFQRGSGPCVAFLPAYGRQGAALLRIFNVADVLRRQGWRIAVLPPNLTLAQRHRVLMAAGADILVMQGARHALNRPAFYPGYRIVYDIDDADFHLPHLAQPVERAMAEVDCVVAGSGYVADWCRAKGAETEVIWTGTPVSARPAPPQARRPPVVAWAQSTPAAYTDEAAWVVDVMRQVAARCPSVRRRLYDRRAQDTSEFLRSFRQAGISVEWRPATSYRAYLASFEDVRLGLAPLSSDNPFSRGKSFGKILAYLDRRVPVIASNVPDYAAFFDRTSGVVSGDPAVWVDQIADLFADAAARQDVADMAHAAFTKRLSVEEAARRLGAVIRKILP